MKVSSSSSVNLPAAGRLKRIKIRVDSNKIIELVREH
jgi:hypothetical protein